jgi:hypothetical protein
MKLSLFFVVLKGSQLIESWHYPKMFGCDGCQWVQILSPEDLKNKQTHNK